MVRVFRFGAFSGAVFCLASVHAATFSASAPEGSANASFIRRERLPAEEQQLAVAVAAAAEIAEQVNRSSLEEQRANHSSFEESKVHAIRTLVVVDSGANNVMLTSHKFKQRPNDVWVDIGPGNENGGLKCVMTTNPVTCSADAGNPGLRSGGDSWGDRFQISTEGRRVCARRLDCNNCGWGLQLRVRCLEVNVEVNIGAGKSEGGPKCINTDQPLICAPTAGNPGVRLGGDSFQDTFEISSVGQQVCATRMDCKNCGWGVFLRVLCTQV